MLPRVGPFSTMKLSKPVRMVDTDQAGFHVSGWKSVMDKHNLWRHRHNRASVWVFFFNLEGKFQFLPGVTLESSIRCYHVDARGFKREFPGKYEFPMIISSCGE